MLDLQPIKDRLYLASPDKGRRVGYPPDADLKNHAYNDLTALVAEVEWLRAKIQDHRDSLDTDDGLLDEADRKLWAVLDA